MERIRSAVLFATGTAWRFFALSVAIGILDWLHFFVALTGKELVTNDPLLWTLVAVGLFVAAADTFHRARHERDNLRMARFTERDKNAARADYEQLLADARRMRDELEAHGHWSGYEPEEDQEALREEWTRKVEVLRQRATEKVREWDEPYVDAFRNATERHVLGHALRSELALQLDELKARLVALQSNTPTTQRAVGRFGLPWFPLGSVVLPGASRTGEGGRGQRP